MPVNCLSSSRLPADCKLPNVLSSRLPRGLLGRRLSDIDQHLGARRPFDWGGVTKPCDRSQYWSSTLLTCGMRTAPVYLCIAEITACF